MAEANDTYQVGVARRDITPPVGIKMCGFAARTESSEGVYHPLCATAVVIDDGATPVLVVGADILGFYDRCEPIRAALTRALPLPEEQIVLAGSHTHCGPHIRVFDIPRLGPLDEEYLATLTARIVEAAEEAWANRAPATLAFGVGDCRFAVSRRRLGADGKVSWGPDPAGPYDHGVPIVLVRRPDGEPACVLYNYACHPTSRAGLLIGGDYVSFTDDRIRANHPGVLPCFVQGCGADQKPRPLDPADPRFTPREVRDVRLLGDELGDAVTAALQSGDMRELSGPVRVRRRVIQLESVPPDADDARAVLAGGDERLRGWAERILEAVVEGKDLPRHAPFEIQTITFGRSLAIVTLAGEITVEHGLRLKRDLRETFDGVLVAGYTNHIVGYVPVRRQIPEGGYCVEWANKFHGRTGRWVDGTEEQIHGTVRDMLA